MLHHLAEGGSAGFVMASGELSNGETARIAVRKALIESDFVDCVVQLSAKLFANTQVPCSLWFLSKNRSGTHGFRKRSGEVLFIDGRSFGSLIDGSRKQKDLSPDEVQLIASVYQQFRRHDSPDEAPGFAAVATHAQIAENRYALTPGRYVGTGESLDADEPFDDRFPALVQRLDEEFAEASALELQVRLALTRVRS